MDILGCFRERSYIGNYNYIYIMGTMHKRNLIKHLNLVISNMFSQTRFTDSYHLSQWLSMGLGHLQPTAMVANVDQSVSCVSFPKQYTNHAAKGQTEWNIEYMELGLFSRQPVNIIVLIIIFCLF